MQTNLKQSITLAQSQSFSKSINYHKEIVRNLKRDFFKQKRQELHLSTKSNQNPFTSHLLQQFWEIPISELPKYIDQIQEKLSNVNGQQLSEDETTQICQDILHLFYTEKFTLPFNFKFRKNKSMHTAIVVGYSSEIIDVQELKYWINYMCYEAKQIIYTAIEPQNQRSQVWIHDEQLNAHLFADMLQYQQAEYTVLQLLKYCPYVTNAFYRQASIKINQIFCSHRKNKSQIPHKYIYEITLILMKKYLFQSQTSFRTLMINLNESIYLETQLSQKHKMQALLNSDLADSLNAVILACQRYGILFLDDTNFCKLIQQLTKSLKENVNNESENQKTYFHNSIIKCCMNYLRLNSMFKVLPSMSKQIQQLRVPESHINFSIFKRLKQFMESQQQRYAKKIRQQIDQMDENEIDIEY